MPWRERSSMDERVQFISESSGPHYTSADHRREHSGGDRSPVERHPPWGAKKILADSVIRGFSDSRIQ